MKDKNGNSAADLLRSFSIWSVLLIMTHAHYCTCFTQPPLWNIYIPSSITKKMEMLVQHRTYGRGPRKICHGIITLYVIDYLTFLFKFVIILRSNLHSSVTLFYLLLFFQNNSISGWTSPLIVKHVFWRASHKFIIAMCRCDVHL